MLVIGTFEQSPAVEQALALLERIGIDRTRIMTVQMDSGDQSSPVSSSRFPGKKTLAFEVGMACATGSSVLGISYGFVLAWGPILWGLFAALVGYGTGFGLTWFIQSAKGRKPAYRGTVRPELTVIVKCSEARFQEVRQVLFQHEALSIGRIDGS